MIKHSLSNFHDSKLLLEVDKFTLRKTIDNSKPKYESQDIIFDIVNSHLRLSFIATCIYIIFNRLRYID